LIYAPTPNNQHVFLVSNFVSWNVLLGKIWKKNENSRKNVNNKKIQKIEITKLKKKVIFGE
jgi:hypothetical protein